MQSTTHPLNSMVMHMVCDECGEDLGISKIYFAEEHLKKYPMHLSYTETKITC